MKAGNIRVARRFFVGEMILCAVLAVLSDGNGCFLGFSQARSQAMIIGLSAVGLGASVILLRRDSRTWKLIAGFGILFHAMMWLPAVWP
jgi:hypothetical protein